MSAPTLASRLSFRMVSKHHLSIVIVFHFIIAALALQTKKVDYLALNPAHLKPSPFCSAPKGHKDGRVPIVHKYGPCSPMGQRNLSDQPSLSADEDRVRWIQSRVAASTASLSVAKSADLKIPAKLGAAVGTLNYVVTVGLGTPSRPLTLVFDTGSDLSWTQCRPCTGGCYSQRDPIFDPAASSTYRNFSCSSPDCATLRSNTGQPTGCTAPSTCVYLTAYGDGSSTVGFYASDTLSLGSAAISNFRFGCGVQNSGLFGSTAGILGLGRGSASAISQSASMYGRRFSYCLPSSSSSTSGFLEFGPTTARAHYTPMISHPNLPSFYFIKLTAIIVAGEILNIPATAFPSPGAVIDSGTVITRLPSAAYSVLRSVFREKMAAYKLTDGNGILDTCYDFSGIEDISIPKIVLRFDGNVDVDMAVTGILYFASQTQSCLSFASTGDAGELTIIGNRQQRTYQVVYDVVGGKIGFVSGQC